MIKFTENEALLLIEGFNGILKSDGITWKSHLCSNISWYASEEAAEYGQDLFLKHRVVFTDFMQRLSELTELEAESVMRRVHKFWNIDENGNDVGSYHIEDTHQKLKDVKLI